MLHLYVEVQGCTPRKYVYHCFLIIQLLPFSMVFHIQLLPSPMVFHSTLYPTTFYFLFLFNFIFLFL